MKKFLAMMLAAVMVFGVAACSSSDSTDGANDAVDNAVETTGVAKEDLKVGFVHVSDPSDMGYTYNHDLGTQEMVKALGLNENQVINKFNIKEDATCDTALRELVEAGCQLIFATSFGFEDYVLGVAADYPEVEFCHATGYQAAGSGLDNVHNYFASIYEARYLAGIAAGLKTKTNKLGYVAAFPFAEVISGYTAFYLGAKSVNPDVTMDVMYTNSWNDPQVEAQVAKALIDGGCDVVSQHSDSTAPATTAEANGVWQVGYNSDMISAAPNASLVSARVNWGSYVTFATEAFLNGEEIPVDWCKGLADGAVYLSPLNEAIIAEGTAEAIEAAKAEIIAGTNHVFDGPLVDVNGETVVKEGEFFAESSTASAPSWAHVLEGVNVIQ